MSKIRELLNQLDDDELEALVTIADKLKNLKQPTTEQVNDDSDESNETIHSIHKNRKSSSRKVRKPNVAENIAQETRSNRRGNVKRTFARDGGDVRANKENLFEDFDLENLSLEEKTELLEASQSDKQNKKRLKNKTHRPTNLVHVRCKMCGVEEDVSPSIVLNANRYKCNDCCCSGG